LILFKDESRHESNDVCNYIVLENYYRSLASFEGHYATEKLSELEFLRKEKKSKRTP